MVTQMQTPIDVLLVTMKGTCAICALSGCLPIILADLSSEINELDD